MAHLQNAPVPSRDFDEAFAFDDGHGHGLLDQHTRAGFKKSLGNFKMRGGGRDDAHGIDLAQEISVMLVRRDFQFRGHCGARSCGGVGNADQV